MTNPAEVLTYVAIGLERTPESAASWPSSEQSDLWHTDCCSEERASFLEEIVRWAPCLPAVTARVIVVDDDDYLREVTEMVLAGAGHSTAEMPHYDLRAAVTRVLAMI